VDPAGFLREQLEAASPDLLRQMVKTFSDALMSAEAEAACGAAYGERSEERTNSRNGYRPRDWDTRAGTVELAIPKLRTGSYFPDWLLQHDLPKVARSARQHDRQDRRESASSWSSRGGRCSGCAGSPGAVLPGEAQDQLSN
jgi:mutator family transposase